MIQEPKPQRKWPLIAGGVIAGGVLLAGGGALGWSWLNDAVVASNGKTVEGSQMEVALYTPDTPAVQAGGVMDVGQLSDGYEHRVRAAAENGYDVDADWAGIEDEAYEPTLRRPSRIISSRDAELRDADTAQPYRPEPEAEVRRLVSDPARRPDFGFNDPRPDYAQERKIRRERSDPRWRTVPGARPVENWREVQPSQPRVAPDRSGPSPRMGEVDEDGYAG